MNEAQENSFDAGSVPVADAQPTGSKNLIRDFFGIILDPIKAFRNILAANYWVGILLVIIIVTAALEQIYHPVVVDMAVAKMSEKAGENTQAIQGILSFYINPAISRPAFFFFTAVSQVGYMLIWTVLAFFIGSVAFGGTAKFKGVWVVCCWAYAIILLQQIVKTPLILATKSVEAGLNLGVIFTENMVGASLHKAMAVIDLFGIWYFIVAGIGLAILYKFSTKKGIGISFIIWLLLTIVGIISVLISGAV